MSLLSHKAGEALLPVILANAAKLPEELVRAARRYEERREYWASEFVKGNDSIMFYSGSDRELDYLHHISDYSQTLSKFSDSLRALSEE